MRKHYDGQFLCSCYAYDDISVSLDITAYSQDNHIFKFISVSKKAAKSQQGLTLSSVLAADNPKLTAFISHTLGQTRRACGHNLEF